MASHAESLPARARARVDVLVQERRHLLNLGYRLLGSLTDAEDVAQETYARWYALDEAERDRIRSPGAWLTTAATRICLDVLGSARVRRERYTGSWLPEPVPDPVTAPDPADQITLDDSVSMALLVVLDTLTAAERVPFVLHDVYAYPFPEIARIVDRTPGACRQLAASARARVRSTDPEAPASPTAEQAATVRRFKQAWDEADIRALVALLDPDVIAVADGGGKASALPEPMRGGPSVARFLVEAVRRGPRLDVVEQPVNGEPGLAARADGAVVTVVAFRFGARRITHLWAIRNPDKLRPWAA